MGEFSFWLALFVPLVVIFGFSYLVFAWRRWRSIIRKQAMTNLTKSTIAASSDEELFALLGGELARQAPVARNSPLFLPTIQTLPVGLRAMAATFELDVSLAMDDLGWHFGNWHDADLECV